MPRMRSNWLVSGAILLAMLMASASLVWALYTGARNDRLAGIQWMTDVYRWQLQSRVDATLEKHAQQEREFQAWQESPAMLFAREVPNKRVIFYANEISENSLSKKFEEPKAHTAADTLEMERKFTEAAELFHNASEEYPPFVIDEIRCLLKSGALPIAQTRYQKLSRESVDSRQIPLAVSAGLLLLEDTNSIAIESHIFSWLCDYSVSIPPARRLFLMRELKRVSESNELQQRLDLWIHAESLVQKWKYLEIPTESLKPFQKAGDQEFYLTWFSSCNLGILEEFAAFDQLENNEPVVIIQNHERAPGEEEGQWVSVPMKGYADGWRLACRMDETLLEQFASEQWNRRLWWALGALCGILLLGSLAIWQVRKQWLRTSMRNSLAATVSHELKTPLASMRLLVDALKDEQIDPKEKAKCLQLLDRENIRLTRLVEQFLNFSRMERGNGSFDKEPVVLKEVIDDSVTILQDKLNACDFQISLPEEEICISANTDALATVFINLLENAIKYSNEKPVIHLKAHTISPQKVSISIEDQGIGMSAREIRNATEAFYQVDTRLTRTTDGCGMGLAIVKWVVEGHEGDFFINSTKDKGTQINIQLPIIKK